MPLFPRSPADAPPVDDGPFESLRRSPRTGRKPRAQGVDQEATVLLDPTQASKTRARRRLIGAIALALAAVVFVPMLFDRTPVPPADDIGLQIPDRNTPFEGRRGVPESSRAPLKASSDLPVVASPPVVAPVVEASAPPPDPTPATTARSDGPEKAVERSSSTDRPTERADVRPADKPKPVVAPPADDPRALAALEGKTDLPPAAPPVAPATVATTGERTYAVQVAAFSAADKARGLRDQLVAGGLRSYTESVSTAQGLRTRVRLGPFPSRDAADHARQKLKTMKLDGSVVPL